ncbi:hypothetical protein [Arthrobacter sp. H20]|uniref:hypothetical protein n=1 Tax=Arthrobacter sp. H20 TaxID=1267981 RepID=UPI0004B4B430|nr:hypothetical protein [Arthrobacter sp. H20]
MSTQHSTEHPLAKAAVHLYTLPLEDFTADRNALAKSTDDELLSGQIRRLSKPSMAGWLINMLVHHRRDAVNEALELGVALRSAQADLDQPLMKSLGQQRQRLLAGLGNDSLSLARELGHGVTASVAAEVDQTFRAAMTDPDAAAAVSSGRLLRALSASGWDAVDLEGAVGGPFDRASGTGVSAPAGSGTAESDYDERVESARGRLQDAERALAEADADAEDAGRLLEQFQDRRTGVAGEIDDLQRRLTELRSDLRALDSQIDDAEREQSGADRAARGARRAVDGARRNLEKLL